MTSGNQSFLSICLPWLAAERLLRRGPAPEAPFATVAKVKGALRLAGLDRQARRLGLRPGMALADARAMHPSLVVAEGDAAAEAALLAAIADWCRRWTPLAALDAPDGVMLDITGAAHLFGGEEALLAQVAEDARTALVGGDATALAAVWARLVRVAERSLVGV